MRATAAWAVLFLTSCGAPSAEPTDSGVAAPEGGPDGAAKDADTADASDAEVDAAVITDANASDGDGGLTVSFSGIVRNLDDTPIGGVTVTVLENTSLTTTTALNGTFVLIVPAETPLTPHFKAKDQVPTVAQTAVFHGPTSGASFRMATPAQYAFISSFGSLPNGSGILRLDVTWMGQCNVVGAHLGTTPASGTVVYAQSDQLPNASYTEIQPQAPGGYVIGASGTVTPFINDVQSPCAQTPWPVNLGSLTVLGPMTIEPGSYHDVTIYVK